MPNAGALSTRRSVNNSNLLERGRIVAEQESVIRPLVAVRRIADVDVASGEKERWALVLHKGIKAGRLNDYRAVRQVGACRHIKGMEVLHELTPGLRQ